VWTAKDADEISNASEDSIGIWTRGQFFTFWQRTWLSFVHVLRLCVRLSLKVTDEFI
jgi:hypothetical protein